MTTTPAADQDIADTQAAARIVEKWIADILTAEGETRTVPQEICVFFDRQLPRILDSLRMYRGAYSRVESVLDGALGSQDEDGAGEGLAADVDLVVRQRDAARRDLGTAITLAQSAVQYGNVPASLKEQIAALAETAAIPGPLTAPGAVARGMTLLADVARRQVRNGNSTALGMRPEQGPKR